MFTVPTARTFSLGLALRVSLPPSNTSSPWPLKRKLSFKSRVRFISMGVAVLVSAGFSSPSTTTSSSSPGMLDFWKPKWPLSTLSSPLSAMPRPGL